jgi:hypothetical protein
MSVVSKLSNLLAPTDPSAVFFLSIERLDVRHVFLLTFVGKPITCKAAVAHGVNDLRIEEIIVAPPKAGEVRLKVVPCPCLCLCLAVLRRWVLSVSCFNGTSLHRDRSYRCTVALRRSTRMLFATPTSTPWKAAIRKANFHAFWDTRQGVRLRALAQALQV